MASAYRKLTPAELERAGWTRNSERYSAPQTDPRGEYRNGTYTISRRQAEQQNYTDAGWRSRADYERRFAPRTKQGRKYAYFRDQALTNRDVKRRSLDRPDSEFNRLYLKARRFNFDRGRSVRGPNSHMARFLAYTGLRDPSATYNVGDTPRA